MKFSLTLLQILSLHVKRTLPLLLNNLTLYNYLKDHLVSIHHIRVVIVNERQRNLLLINQSLYIKYISVSVIVHMIHMKMCLFDCLYYHFECDHCNLPLQIV